MRKTIPAVIIIILVIAISFLFIPEENYIVGIVLDDENMLIYEMEAEYSNLSYEKGILCPTMGLSFQAGDRIYVDADMKTMGAPAELTGVKDIQLVESGHPLFGVGEYMVVEKGMVIPVDEKPCTYFSCSRTNTDGYKIGDVLGIHYSAILESAPSQIRSVYTELIESRGFDPGCQVIYGDSLTSQLHTMEVTVTGEHEGWYMVSHDGTEYTIPQHDEIFKTGDKLTITYSIGTQEIDGYNTFTRFCRADKAY